jgi:hypothetical protein
MRYQRERVDCTLGHANLENLNATSYGFAS